MFTGLFCLLVLSGCHRNTEPKAFTYYIGEWNFTTQLSIAQHDSSVSSSSCTMLVEDSIINFRGSISSVDGNNILLIEFFQNELIECRLDDTEALLWEAYSGHDGFVANPNSPLGEFSDYDHLIMQFNKMEKQGEIHKHYRYKVTGTKKK